MSKVQLHADVRYIRRRAPAWAKWFVVTDDGNAYWQNRRGEGWLWWMGTPDSLCESVCYQEIPLPHGYAIELTGLRAGSVHILSTLGGLGRIAVIPQSQWVAARKRKGRK